MQAFLRDGYLHIVRRVARAAALAVALEEHGKGLAHAARKIRFVHRLGDSRGARSALFAHGHVDLAHLRSLRARADGIREDVHVGKADARDEVKRLREFLLRLLGKARDEVRRDGRVVKILTQQVAGFHIARRIIFAVHTL